MHITLNGQARELDGPQALPQLLAELQVPAHNGVAVLLNGAVVRKTDWAQTTVQPGDELEIVRATAGG